MASEKPTSPTSRTQQPAESIEPPVNSEFRTGQRVEVEWKGAAYDAVVLSVETGPRWKIRYDGYASDWDETVARARIRPRRPKLRDWGPEQATGAPNTDHAGDYATAWASRTADAPSEWLLLESKSTLLRNRRDRTTTARHTTRLNGTLVVPDQRLSVNLTLAIVIVVES